MIEWLQLSACTEGLFFVLAAGTEVEQLSIVPPVSAYDNTDHSHAEFVSTAQGGPDENAGLTLLIDTFPGTLLALFRLDSCLPHPRGQLCQDTHFVSICHPYMLMGFPELWLRYCFLFAGIGAFVPFHSGRIW